MSAKLLAELVLKDSTRPIPDHNVRHYRSFPSRLYRFDNECPRCWLDKLLTEQKGEVYRDETQRSWDRG